MANKLKIRKGDRVKVIAGRSKGKIGDVLRVLAADQRVVVSGVNVIKRHTKPSRTHAPTKPHPPRPGRHYRGEAPDPRVERGRARSQDRQADQDRLQVPRR